MFKYSMIGLGLAQALLLIAYFVGAIAWSLTLVLLPLIVAAVAVVTLVVTALIIVWIRG